MCYASSLPAGFIYLHQVDPTIDKQLDFATENNFVGVRLEGYQGDQVICTQALAKKLKIVQKALKKQYPHYSLKILDAYRPIAAVEHIKKWAGDLSDQKTKARFYPDIEKKDLLGKYLAANRSSHSRGSTVDIIIVDANTNFSLDYGPDFFGSYAHINYKNLTEVQRKNRKMLRQLMVSHGFKPYDEEFWHFTLKNEPFPDTYFSFAIENEN